MLSFSRSTYGIIGALRQPKADESWQKNKKRDTLTFRFLNTVQISKDNRLDRFLIPVLLAIGILYSGVQILAGDWVLAIVSGVSVVMLLALATVTPLQTIFLHRDFNRSHAFYIAMFWLYSLLWVGLLRNLYTRPVLWERKSALLHSPTLILCDYLPRLVDHLCALVAGVSLVHLQKYPHGKKFLLPSMNLLPLACSPSFLVENSRALSNPLSLPSVWMSAIRSVSLLSSSPTISSCNSCGFKAGMTASPAVVSGYDGRESSRLLR